jgi:hypothetical protein
MTGEWDYIAGDGVEVGRVAGRDVAPPRLSHSRRSEMAGRHIQHDGVIMAQSGEGGGRRVDRVATGRLGGGPKPLYLFVTPFNFSSCGYI